ncbi:MAG: serine hydrolase [Ktedonobacteraceae bacterium]
MYTDIEVILHSLSGSVACIVARMEPDKPRQLVTLNPDTIFPAASLAKLPILVELARQLAEPGCAYTWDTRLAVPAAARVPSDGVLANLSPDLRPTIHDLAHLMITISDNTASNVLLDLLGLDAINASMRELGLQGTRLERRFMDFEARRAGRDNWTTAADMALLLAHIHHKRVPERERLLQILLSQNDYHILPAYWNEELLFAHKTGGLTGIMHDAGLLYRTLDDPTPLLIVALTAEQPDIPLTNLNLSRLGQAIRQEWLQEPA